MTNQTLRNLLGAVVALILTTLTTQTIVHATPRPYLLATAPQPEAGAGGTVHLALCDGRGNRVC
jgi:hypothetical protein